MSWAAEELKTANLGDKRRNQRLIKIVEDLSAISKLVTGVEVIGGMGSEVAGQRRD
jgi:hypothetical protein